MSLALENRTRIGKLGDVLVFRNDIVHPRDNPRGGATFVGLEHIERDTGVRIGSEAIKLEEMSGRRSRFKKGDIVYGYLRPYLNKVWIADLDGICSVDQYVFQVTPKNDLSYIAHYLRSEIFLKTAPIDGTPGQLPRIRSGEITATPIPLPPLAEQRRIAAILDAADALRQQRRQALRLLDQLSQSIFLDMFGDPEGHGWPMSTVEEVASSQKNAIRTGPFGSQLLHEEFVAEGIAVLGIDNAVANEFRWGQRRYIPERKYTELERYTVKPGDVIITIMGTCGRCAIVPTDIPLAINTKHLCCITLDPAKCLPEFMHAYFLQHPTAKSYLGQTSKGAIMDGLNMGIVKSMPIPVPPIDLQQQFAALLQVLAVQKKSARDAASHLDTLFAALQHRAFRGEL
jgi:type I restriction enzyme, S subunit